MPLPQAKKLIEEAKKRKLSPKERRHAIAFLLATEPQTRNTDMAEMFGVSERMIRIDRNAIMEDVAKQVRSVDPALILADVFMELERQLHDIEDSKRKATKGTKAYLSHCIAPVKLRSEVISLLQSTGFIPKELGNLTVEKFEFKTTQLKSGEIVSRRIDEFDYLLEGPAPQLTEGKESEVQEAEFEEVTASPTNGEPSQNRHELQNLEDPIQPGQDQGSNPSATGTPQS